MPDVAIFFKMGNDMIKDNLKKHTLPPTVFIFLFSIPGHVSKFIFFPSLWSYMYMLFIFWY